MSIFKKRYPTHAVQEWYVDVPWPVVDPKNILDLTPGKMVEVKKGYW